LEVDNLIMVAIPGAMHAGPTTLLFRGSLAVALVIAGTAGSRTTVIVAR
jgi:hypothetical protein